MPELIIANRTFEEAGGSLLIPFQAGNVLYYGIDGKAGNGFYSGFLGYVFTMGNHCVCTDGESVGNFFVGMSCHQEFQHLCFPFRERRLCFFFRIMSIRLFCRIEMISPGVSLICIRASILESSLGSK